MIVLAHVGDVDDFRDDVAAFAGITPEVFPAWEKLPRELDATDEVFGKRLRVLNRLAGPLPPRLVVAPFQAMLQPVPKPEALPPDVPARRRGRRRARRGADGLAPRARHDAGRGRRGPRRVQRPRRHPRRLPDRRHRPGPHRVLRRRGRVDPPVRRRIAALARPLELGHPDRPAELRRGRTSELSVPPPSSSPRGPGSPCSSRPTSARRAGITSAGSTTRAGLYTVESTFERLIRFPTIAVSTLAADSLEATCHLRIESVERFSGDLARVKAELDGAAAGDRVLIACHNAAEVERLGEVFSDTELAQPGRLHLTVGRIRSGFHLIDASTLVIGDHELFARAEVRRPVTRRRYESRAIDSFLDLNEGDLVVHVNHGIARYRGLQFVDKSDEHAEETLLLEFAEGTKLYVPIAKIDLVQKYVGGGKAAPTLSKIGSSTWEKRKKRVAEAVVDLAQELIDIQAQRASQPGFAYPGRGQPLDGRVRGGLPLRGDARPARGHRGRPSATWPRASRWTA